MEAYGGAVQRIAGAIPYELAAARPRLKHHGLLRIGHSAKWPGLTTPGFALGEPGVYLQVNDVDARAGWQPVANSSNQA
jgi:hypothetical protein